MSIGGSVGIGTSVSVASDIIISAGSRNDA
jgi:hypothetical protein